MGSKITWNGIIKKEINSRIAQVKMVFNLKRKYLCCCYVKNRKMLQKKCMKHVQACKLGDWRGRQTENEAL